jgi:hypothetical protein
MNGILMMSINVDETNIDVSNIDVSYKSDASYKNL